MSITRKALVSILAAATISTGIVTPAFAQEAKDTNTAASQPAAQDQKKDENKPKEGENNPKKDETPDFWENVKKGSTDDKTKAPDPKKIGSWIAIIGTLITVLTSVLTFISKIPGMFKK